MTNTQTIAWLNLTAEAISRDKDYLTELDSPIGDADHGINMDRGFRRVAEKLEEWADHDIGEILKSTGMLLISSVGGASGPLYGTFFLRAGLVARGKRTLTAAECGAALEAGLQGIVERGRAQLGDKTMVDAWRPALDAFQKAVGDGLPNALEKALMACEEGVKSTIPMKARKGRASYLGERSVGHQDPGATSSLRILKCLLESLS